MNKAMDRARAVNGAVLRAVNRGVNKAVNRVSLECK
jgi:hypothetical protein